VGSSPSESSVLHNLLSLVRCGRILRSSWRVSGGGSCGVQTPRLHFTVVSNGGLNIPGPAFILVP
jgi:hypothetical protein